MTLAHVDGFAAIPPGRLLDLPGGFHVEVLARSGPDMPGRPSGVGAFAGNGQLRLVQDHDQGRWGDPAAVAGPDRTYDGVAAGGVSVLTLDDGDCVLERRVVLAGTFRTATGAATPWHTWLTCERTEQGAVGRSRLEHGWIFEVDPFDDRNNAEPAPLEGLGRFSHAGVAVDASRGHVYLPEAGREPNGLLYRFRPTRRAVGYGDLRDGGTLEALHVDGLRDVATVATVGASFPARWVPVPDPRARRTSARRQFDHLVHPTLRPVKGEGGPVTRWPRLERVRWAAGMLWIVCGRTLGSVDWSEASHGGQVWSYDPSTGALQLARILGVHELHQRCSACATASNLGPVATAMGPNRDVVYAGLPDAGLTVAIRGPFEHHH